jgi:DNA polymerase-3 subunit delta'
MPFADFPAQRHVVELLQRAIERGRLGHAYLFTGERLEELEAVARALAQAVNCESPRRTAAGSAVDACGHCTTCRTIGGDIHGDVQWLRPESKLRQIAVEPTRELIRVLNLKAASAPFKVAVMVSADRMNASAANAFLKTLEEPPPRSLLVLLSTEPQRLMETVLSRCLRLNFASDDSVRLDDASRAWLRTFGDAAAEGTRGLLARYRLLGTLLDRLAALKEEVEATMTARSPLERFEDAEPELRERWEDELKASIEAEYRWRRAGIVRGLQAWLRDVWLVQLGVSDGMAALPELAGQSRAVASRLAEAEATENLRVIERMQRLLHTNVQEALALEVGLVSLRL